MQNIQREQLKKEEIRFKKLLDLIYPQVCSICGKLNKKSICNKCKIKLQKEFKYKIDYYEEDENKNFIEHHYFFK